VEEEEMGHNFAEGPDLGESYPAVNYSRGHIEDSSFGRRVVADVEGSVGNLKVGTLAGCEEGLVVIFDQVKMHSTHEQVSEGAIRTKLRP
jgi:hypothetical protein